MSRLFDAMTITDYVAIGALIAVLLVWVSVHKKKKLKNQTPPIPEVKATRSTWQSE